MLFSDQACSASCLIEGVEMPRGLQLWDKSTVVHTALPGANRYERYLSFDFNDMFLSWAKQSNTCEERSHHCVIYTQLEPLKHIPVSQGVSSIIWIIISDNSTASSEHVLLQLYTVLNQQHPVLPQLIRNQCYWHKKGWLLQATAPGL